MTYSLRVCDMPATERPRERLLSYGAKRLSAAELVAILLGTGQGPGGLSAVGLGQHLLQRLGEEQPDGNGLPILRDVSAEELMQVSGIGPAKAATILAALELGKRVLQSQPPNLTVVDDPSVSSRSARSRTHVAISRALCRFAVRCETPHYWLEGCEYWHSDRNASAS